MVNLKRPWCRSNEYRSVDCDYRLAAIRCFPRYQPFNERVANGSHVIREILAAPGGAQFEAPLVRLRSQRPLPGAPCRINI